MMRLKSTRCEFDATGAPAPVGQIQSSTVKRLADKPPSTTVMRPRSDAAGVTRTPRASAERLHLRRNRDDVVGLVNPALAANWIAKLSRRAFSSLRRRSAYSYKLAHALRWHGNAGGNEASSRGRIKTGNVDSRGTV